MFVAGLIVGAVVALALMLGIGAIEWETTYEVVKVEDIHCAGRTGVAAGDGGRSESRYQRKLLT